MFPVELKKSVELTLSLANNKSVYISGSRSIGGGSINEACLLVTNTGKYFIKYNSAEAFPGMFEKEAAGLKLLAGSNTIKIPGVIATDNTDEYSYLILEFIESAAPGHNFWINFGKKLADLHQNTSDYFGLDHDNYIGSLIQTNKKHADFIEFFILERIEPQLEQARNKSEFSQSDTRYFHSLYKTLNNIIPPEKPALIHGDLWSGNFMVASDGSPRLVDPAVYYGHREADIAMTQLFGGFKPEFYAAYNQAWAMEKGWRERMDIFNLYPLLVHVNLFGGGYARQVLQIIRQF
jgi:protein-ribulosamine 3-kinase